MDELALLTLKAEIEADLVVIAEAAEKARKRFGTASDVELEACAFQLVRMYNCIEQMALRTARAFENQISDDGGWHAEIIGRMCLDIPEVRPALFPKELKPALQELRGFRHIIVHAYDLKLKKERVADVLAAATKVADASREFVASFFQGLPR